MLSLERLGSLPPSLSLRIRKRSVDMKTGREIALRFTGFLLILAVWQFAGPIRDSPALPPPIDVFQTAYYLIRDGTIWPHMVASLSIILQGIAIAVVFGFVLGVVMFQYRAFRIAALPVVESVRGIAALTLFPMLIVLLGIGAPSRIFVIFWTAWPAVVLSTMHSLNIDKGLVEAGMALGMKDWRILYAIRIPVAAQGIVAGIRIGVGGGWIGLVAAEMLGATNGLGYFLLWSAQSFRFDRVYAIIIIIAATGGVMNFALLMVQKHFQKRLGGTQL